MKASLLELFSKTIARETGLQIRPQDGENLSKKILERMKCLQMARSEEYYQLLNSQTEAGKAEWEKLIVNLTTTETYFFRDRGQIDLLKNVLLPELIAQKVLSKQKTLRLWSAGCSTGEEPYSLAILARELIADWQDWKILILGTDINERVLEKARKGVYGSWSFRQVDISRQNRYFQRVKGEWKLDDEIQKMVRFFRHNLVKDDCPENLDLIICRNVFVYFKPELISLVVRKFSEALRQEGYLITAHAELHGQKMDGFKAKVFPESLVYQKSQDCEENTRDKWLNFSFNLGEIEVDKERSWYEKKTQKQERITPRVGTGESLNEITPKTILAEAETLFKNKKYALAIEKAERAIASDLNNYDAHYLIAQIYGNLGDYEKAEFFCQKALEIEPFSVDIYHLLVHLAEERGEREKAKNLLKKIIYLCPSSISAYVELADIYESEGEMVRAKKMKKTALELLTKLPKNATVEYRGEISASDFIQYLKQLL
ncbi:MAG: tetratricopeptide repeat protein [Okeania sp. SIO2H7]|nr:tetratricopeptide repeat protein [Okeania sp. SIO2H7]